MPSILTSSLPDTSITQLHVSKPFGTQCQETNLRTAYDVVNSSPTDFIQASPAIKKELIKLQIDIKNALDESGNLEWLKFLPLKSITLVPTQLETAQSLYESSNLLTETVKQILDHTMDERAWIIIKHRFELEDASALALQELGDAFNLTRERVRQIEAKALGNLRKILLDNDYTGQKFRVHFGVVQLLETLLTYVRPSYYIREDELYIQVTNVLPKIWLFTCLVMELLGYKKTELRDKRLSPVWMQLKEKKQEKKLIAVIETLNEILTFETSQALDSFSVLVKLNKRLSAKDRVRLEEIGLYLSLCSSIETCEGGKFRGKFEHLVGRSNQVERLLTEAEGPVSTRELVRQINSRLVPLGEKLVKRENLANQMVDSGLFTPIGKSGEWGLKSWELQNRSVLDTMKEALTVHNRPLTKEDIYEYVVNIRQARVSEKSIKIYLKTEKEIFRPDGNNWVLTSWQSNKQATVWDKATVSRFIEDAFRHKKVKEVEYGVLTALLAEKAKVGIRQARGMLIHNPAIKSRAGKGDKRYAVFQTHGEGSKVSQHRPRKKTLQQRVDELIPQIITQETNYELPLSELVKRIQAQQNVQRYTLYQYIDRSSLIKKRMENQKVVCFLASPKGDIALSETKNIKSPQLRNNVERSLSFLTPENVDIALSSLSKEFEGVLKEFVTKSVEKNRQLDKSLGDPKRWRLVDLVNYAYSTKVIDSPDDLHYLRQVRNQRAHESMPDAKEMQELYKTGGHIAGLYVHYIRHFDNLLHAT